MGGALGPRTPNVCQEGSQQFFNLLGTASLGQDVGVTAARAGARYALAVAAMVAAINPDSALFSSDFRAPERLFSLLLQAAGRAGRDAALGGHSEVWVQTFQPAHPVYAALKNYDYPHFAHSQLQEREQAGMPPFSHQALVRADARTQEAAQAFLNTARQRASAEMAHWPGWAQVLEHVMLYPAVPMAMQRVANVERAQMLVESPSRHALQTFLAAWQDLLRASRSDPASKGLMRWAIDVDPLAI